MKTAYARRRCYAMTLIDVTVGIVLVTTASTILTQIVLSLAEHRHSQRQVQQAADLLANITELFEVETLPLVSSDSVEYQKKIKPLETLTAHTLPDGKLKIEPLSVSHDSITVIRLTISWDAGGSRPRRKIEFLRAVPKP